jgi:hypothetical protein
MRRVRRVVRVRVRVCACGVRTFLSFSSFCAARLAARSEAFFSRSFSSAAFYTRRPVHVRLRGKSSNKTKTQTTKTKRNETRNETTNET